MLHDYLPHFHFTNNIILPSHGIKIFYNHNHALKWLVFI